MTAEEAPEVRERRLRSDVFLMLGTKGAVMVLNAVGSILVARYLGPEDRGIVAVAFSLTLMLIQFGDFGLALSNTYWIAKEPATRPRIVGNALWFAVVLGAGLILIGVAVRLIAPGVVKGLGWTELLVALGGIPLGLLTAYLHACLLGEARTVAYNVAETVLAVGSVVALAIGFVVFDMGVLGALIVMVGGQTAGAITYGTLLAAKRRGISLAPDLGLARRMLRYGFRVYVANLIGYMLIRVDVLFVNGYLGPEQAGYYSVAVGLTDALYVIPVVVSVNVFPRVVRRQGAEMSAQIFRSVALLYLGLCLVTVPFAGWAIELLYGERFAPSTELYYWLLPGIYALGTLNVLSYHFAARGFPWGAVLVWVPGLALNIMLLVLLLPGGPTYAAPLASSIAYGLVLVLHLHMFARETSWRELVPRWRETVDMVRGSFRPA